MASQRGREAGLALAGRALQRGWNDEVRVLAKSRCRMGDNCFGYDVEPDATPDVEPDTEPDAEKEVKAGAEADMNVKTEATDSAKANGIFMR